MGWLLALGAVIFGLMSGAGNVVGPSLKADAIDWDEAETGERKEGTYFAAWNFLEKAAAGVSGWAIGMVLSATGFEPNVAQSDTALLGIRLLASPWPAVLHVAAFALVWRFGLDESVHRDARERAPVRATAERRRYCRTRQARTRRAAAIHSSRRSGLVDARRSERRRAR